MRSITRFFPCEPTSAARPLLSRRFPAQATTAQRLFARRFWAIQVRRLATQIRARQTARWQDQAAKRLRRSPKGENGPDCARAILPHAFALAVVYARQDFSAVRCSCCEKQRVPARFAIAERSKLRIPRGARRAILGLPPRCLRCAASRSVVALVNEEFRSSGASRHRNAQ